VHALSDAGHARERLEFGIGIVEHDQVHLVPLFGRARESVEQMLGVRGPERRCRERVGSVPERQPRAARSLAVDDARVARTEIGGQRRQRTGGVLRCPARGPPPGRLPCPSST